VGEDDKAKVQPVTTGAALKSEWLIEDGLKAGDRVIVDGVIKVRPGSPVKAAAPASNSEPTPSGSGRKQSDSASGVQGATA
jgi:membrane fusion protein (multidrug efflux system)